MTIIFAEFSSDVSAWANGLTALFTGLTVVVALLGVFKEQVHRFIFPIAVNVQWNSGDPTCSVHSYDDDLTKESAVHAKKEWSVYLRLKVTNASTTDAQLVQVFIQSLDCKNGETWEPVPRFVPMRLVWSHTNVPANPLLTGETMQLCNLGRWATRHEQENEPRIPDIAGRHFQLLTEVLRYRGNFLGATHEMRRASKVRPAPGSDVREEGPPCETEYRFMLLVAAVGGIIYKACWHLHISEVDEYFGGPPTITLSECKVYQRQQARWPFQWPW